MTEFSTVPEFDSDLKQLSKDYPSLNNDLERLKTALKVTPPKLFPGTVRISDLGEGVSDPIYKVKHFRCESLKGKGCRSGIRVIFGYDGTTKQITFIQIYHKNRTANEDKNRIRKYFEAA